MIIPLGALEQHGPHLPISTDQVIAEALALRAATEVGACAVGPCVPIGVSNHHLGFAGTTTLSAPVMASIQVEIVTSLLANGFRNAYLVTGHAGNCASMAEAVRRLNERFGNHVVAFDDWPAQRSALHAVATDLGLDPERGSAPMPDTSRPASCACWFPTWSNWTEPKPASLVLPEKPAESCSVKG